MTFLFHSAAGIVFHICHAEQLHVVCHYDACGKMDSYTVELGCNIMRGTI